MKRGEESGTHYDVLGVAPDASYDEIRDQYRRLAKIVHPDRGGDPIMFDVLDDAWDVLKDPRTRATYDASLAQRATKPDARPATSHSPTAQRHPADRPSAPPPPRPRTTTGWLKMGASELVQPRAPRGGDRTIPEVVARTIAWLVVMIAAVTFLTLLQR